MMDESSLRVMHSVHSSLREKIVEHRLIADILQFFWKRGIVDVEVLKSEFDAAGYDLVLSTKNIVRHIQLKAILQDGSRRDVTVNLNLQSKVSGCVVWLDVDLDLNITRFRWFGSGPGQPLPDMTAWKVGKHSKADSTGKKNERPNHRILPLSKFEELATLGELVSKLVGPV